MGRDWEERRVNGHAIVCEKRLLHEITKRAPQRTLG